MSIKEGSKRARTKSQKRESLDQHLVPETVIRNLIGSLGIRDVSDVAARFQSVSDLTGGAFVRQIDRLDPSDLRLIRTLAGESKNKYYRQIMKAIVASLAQGRHGINASHLAANSVVECAFRFTGEYISALNLYRDELRKKKPVKRK